MIKFEKPEVWGWEHAIRGMRNPLNSWERSDSYPAVDCGKCGIIDREGICHPKEHDCTPYECYAIGDNDKDLMTRLIRGGAPHRKFLRQIFVSVDITAPLYWWKEFDTYKVGTTANSCSTMHKIQAKEFTFEDFSCEHLDEPSKAILGVVINELNNNRGWYNDYNRLVSEGDFTDVERKPVLVEHDSAFALLFQSEANGHYDLRKPSEYAGISQRSQAGRVAYVLRLDSHPPLWFALEGRCG